MGVYIPNLEMPTSCFDCPIAHPALGKSAAAILGCPLIGKTLSALFYEEKRMDDCPLVSVPPHGRLIDANALIEHLEFTMKHCTIEGHTAQRYREMIVELNIAPTIIPAEPCSNLSKPCKEDEAK